MDPIYLDQIYLDKGGDENPSFNWVYYRLTPVDGLGNPAGKEGSTIQICRLKWPSLGDIGTAIDTPGPSGRIAAITAVSTVLTEWGVDHESRGILIGLRERQVNINQPGANIPLAES
jgi:hypothetical protein